jgi:hypothetical protein
LIKKINKKQKDNNDQIGTEINNMGGSGVVQKPSALKKNGTACTILN